MLNSNQLRKIRDEDIPIILKALEMKALDLRVELSKSYQNHLYMETFYNTKVSYFYIDLRSPSEFCEKILNSADSCKLCKLKKVRHVK